MNDISWLYLPTAFVLHMAHALDEDVLDAYGFYARKTFLPKSSPNFEVAKRIENREAVTAPHLLKDYPKPKELVTSDRTES